jgi:ribosomal protein S18 acetylase RimI-like enzyme
MEKLVIVKIGISELLELQNISKETFMETFALNNSADNMNLYLENNLSLDTLSAEINTIDSDFYFALRGKVVLGYMKLNFGSAQIELKGINSIELERIYVLKKYQRNKIGQQLLDKAIDIASQMQLEFIWLGVWEENWSAIKFYTKNNFHEFDRHLFLLGEDRQTDIMMKKNLRL